MLWVLGFVFVAVVLVNLFRVRRVGREMVSGSVSILIPARNEEFILPACLLSAVFTNAAEILVYNDGSEDGTANVVYSSMARYERIRLIEGGAVPEGWVGKAWACQQLADSAKSEWVLFLDAGARISSQGLERLVAEAGRRKLTWLTCLAEVERPTFAQRVILPALQFVAVGFAPGFLAQGSCTLVHRATYELVGGHAAVRSEIGADLALKRVWLRRGERAACFGGAGILNDGRRADFAELWAGLRRHLYVAFQDGVAFGGFVAVAAVCSLMPWWPWMMALVLLRLVHAVRFRQRLWSALLHPLAMVFILCAAVASWVAARSRRGVEWKGRSDLVD